MCAKNVSSDRRRSRPVTKPSAAKKLKRNKPALFLAILIVFMLIFSGFYVVFSSLTDSDNNGSTYDTEYPVAEITTSKGLIAVELYNDKEPYTCENFINLANDGFYDGLVFHRVANLDNGATDTRVIQGGGFDTDRNQKASPYGQIDLEINDDLTHEDGAIAMARTSDPNSATSQFYICDGAHPFLDDAYRQANYGDRGYAVFGKVISGMGVVREIARVETTTKTLPATGQSMSNWPVNDILINSVTIVNN
jgi:cyclophilin family peptidyl-prolyl cis-trans isomerase